jgi:CheY-like chemotaxis protein
MLVEDEPFIALDLETILASMGHDVVGVADCLAGAIVLAEASRPEAAFIDVNLRDGFTGLDVACALRDRFGIRFGFVTGNPEQLPTDRCGALGVIEKPFTDADITGLLARLSTASERPGVIDRHD